MGCRGGSHDDGGGGLSFLVETVGVRWQGGVRLVGT